MPRLKYYNETTSEWEYAVVGAQGPAGPQGEFGVGVVAGVISQYAGSTAPTGYLLCEGQSISTTTYSSLFDVIGYTYGGSGESFNVPNLQNRIPVGKGPDAEFDTLGEIGGSKTNTLTTANMAAHTHSGTTAAETQEHSHSGSTGTVSADHSHSGTTNDQNVIHTHNFSAVRGRNDIQRAAGTSSFLRANDVSTGVTTASSNGHSHTFGTGGISANHTHSFTTGGRSATHNHTYTTDDGTGTATAVNNLQPYIVVNYIIKT